MRFHRPGSPRTPPPALHPASVEQPQIARHPANIAARAFPLKPQNLPLIATLQTAKSSPFQPDNWPTTSLINGLDVALNGDFLTNQASQNSVPGILRFGPVSESVHVGKNVVEAAKTQAEIPPS